MEKADEMNPTQTIRGYVEQLCKDGHRATCSPEEAAAAWWMKDKLETWGLETRMHRFRTHRTFGELVLIHLLLALVGLLCLHEHPWTAALLLAVSGVSFFGEFTCRWHIGRRFLPGRVSQNVIGHYRPEAPKRTIIFSGHLDSAQAGLIFNPRLSEKVVSSRALPGPLFLPFASIILILLSALGVAFAGEVAVVQVMDWIGALILVVAAVLMLQWMRATPVPGANDNASGISAVLTMAEKLMKNPPENTEFYFIGFGAEEAHLSGSIAFVREFGSMLDRDSTYLINFDGIAAGEIYWVTHENPLVPQEYPDNELLILARSLSRTEPFSSIQATRIDGATDSMPFVRMGIKSISLCGLEKNRIPFNYHSLGDSPEKMGFENSALAISFAEAITGALRV